MPKENPYCPVTSTPEAAAAAAVFTVYVPAGRLSTRSADTPAWSFRLAPITTFLCLIVKMSVFLASA